MQIKLILLFFWEKFPNVWYHKIERKKERKKERKNPLFIWPNGELNNPQPTIKIYFQNENKQMTNP
jgi:hypothetical protein